MSDVVALDRLSPLQGSSIASSCHHPMARCKHCDLFPELDESVFVVYVFYRRNKSCNGVCVRGCWHTGNKRWNPLCNFATESTYPQKKTLQQNVLRPMLQSFPKCKIHIDRWMLAPSSHAAIGNYFSESPSYMWALYFLGWKNCRSTWWLLVRPTLLHGRK